MYSTRAFAALTGVTVKALRHYERVGLLGPMRTRARYRRYAFADLQQIERILALKSLGLSLTSIKLVLKRGPVGLEAHRAVLEDRRARLNRAIAAVHEIQRDADPHAALQRFISGAAWDRWEAKRQRVAVDRPPDRAPASAVALFHEIAAALDHLRPSRQPPTPPGRTEVANAETLQALVGRSREIIAPETRDAWSRRAAWPGGLRRYVASCYEMEPDIWERVVGFIDAHGTR
jgi:DNA-binding transcriptional MerR regulator